MTEDPYLQEVKNIVVIINVLFNISSNIQQFF